MSEADDLRKEISKARERVTRKIRRLRVEKKVNVAGVRGIDPRQYSHNDMKSFSTQELRTVLHEYNQFTNRNVQYVPLKGGGPMRAEVWKPIEKRAKSQKAKADDVGADIAIIPHPIAGTIGDQQGKFKREGADKGLGPYRAYDIDSTNFRTEAAAIKFAQQKLNQFDQDTWEEDQTGFNRQWLGKILTEMGESSADYDNLSDWQFTVLWYGTDFLTDKGYLYEIWKSRNDKNQVDKSDPEYEEKKDSAITRAYRHVLENVPKTREESNQKYPKPKKK